MPIEATSGQAAASVQRLASASHPTPALEVPYQVLALETASARWQWKLARHPLFSFMFETVHPDIDIHGGAPFGPNFD